MIAHFDSFVCSFLSSCIRTIRRIPVPTNFFIKLIGRLQREGRDPVSCTNLNKISASRILLMKFHELRI